MSWSELIDGPLWLVSLGVSVFLGWLVYRRRDLPARLFMAMVAALVVLQVVQLAEFASRLSLWLLPGPGSEAFARLVSRLWPVDTAALVAFGAVTLHLFLVFPTESRIIRIWRWSPLLFYLPAVLLSAMVLAHLALPPADDGFLGALGRLGIGNNTIQLLFVIVALSLALLRLGIIYFSRSTPLVRRQLAWILWGFAVGGGLAILTDYMPRLTGLPRLAAIVPGLDQLPTLIFLSSFALSIIRHHTFDLTVIVHRSVVYSILMVAITGLYLALAMILGGFFRSLVPASVASAAVVQSLAAVSTTLVIVLVALPLRSAIQRLVEKVLFRPKVDYQRLLQEYSRLLTNPSTLPDLLSTIAEQLTEIWHPAGLAIVLAENHRGYKVALSRGSLASYPMWQKGAWFEPTHFVRQQVNSRQRSLYVPWHAYDVLPQHRQDWQQLEESGVCALIPMHLSDRLIGWLALGPKLSELPYSHRDFDFLGTLADQSCVALENARLYGEMQRRAIEMALLAMVSSTISSYLDLDRVFETIVESVVQVIGCEKSAILEVNKEGSEQRIRTSKGLSPAYIQAALDMPLGPDDPAAVLASGQQFIVPDIQADPRLSGLAAAVHEEGISALVGTPLVGREGILGMLIVYFAQPYTPTASDLEVLTTFANQAAIAVENAHLYKAVTCERDRAEQLYQQTDAALDRRVEELTTIEDISRQLTRTLDLDQVMSLVLERALQATGAERGVISLYEPDKNNIRLLAQSGYPASLEQYRSQPWPDTRGITGRVARTGCPVLVPDVSLDPDYVAAAPTTRSQLTLPISDKGQVIGLITLESDRPAAFGTEHVRFIELLADHAAIGLNNARLFQQVVEGRDRLEAILNSTQDAVIMLDQEGKITLINPRVRDVLGPAGEVWLHSLDVLDLDRALASTATISTELSLTSLTRRGREGSGQVLDMTLSFQRNGQQCYVEGTVSPVFNAAGGVIGRVIVLRDVTRRQEVEQFREDLTSMVIHNLQGPLAALITSLESLCSEDDDGAMTGGATRDGADMSQELLRIAMSSAQKLYSRIESVLLIRRMEDKKLPMDRRVLPLPGMIEMVLDEYRPLATAIGVRLSTAFEPNWFSVPVDEDLIGRVFSNLVDNALKYTPGGGWIEVRARLDGDPESRCVLCAVSDSGTGIASHLQEAIFDKFRRGQAPPSGRRKGMGIGLYFCKLAVEAHGGRIWVESEKGQGTTFYFTLPIQGGFKLYDRIHPGSGSGHDELSGHRF